MVIKIFVIIFILLVGLIIIYIILSPTKNRNDAEKKVSTTLSCLPDKEYIVLNDLMFKKGSSSTQIDHIVVSIYGIFIIETKNHKGLIFGNSEKDYWIQNIWGNKYSLYNPLRQNQFHIRFLINKFRELSEYQNYIYSVVVFVNASELQLSGDFNCVVERTGLNSYIGSFNQNVIPIEKCRYFADLLIKENILDIKQRSDHNQNVLKSIEIYNAKVKRGICPRCGELLVFRSGKYGDFIGCSNYPRCKYTKTKLE